MGSFYANIHFRTIDRPLIERGWQSYWEGREESSWCWVSPVYAGWVSLFDWRSDQPDTGVLTDLAAHIGRAAECVTLAFSLQDSALAEYWLFNQGDEVDHYTSNVDYFADYAQQPGTNPDTEGVYAGYGPDSGVGYPMLEDLSDGGNTGLLKSLVGTTVSDIELEAILRSPARIADDILTALASAIGINDIWASLGYHYLAREGDTISAYEQFHHLPAGQPPNLQRFPER
jgi:hypothetical protein